MSLLYPFALFGLLAIPLLILIYIIKNRYTEQIISSTYIWNLSERFLKRRVPISRLAGIISLILQILIVALVSLAMAHPMITLADSANAYCFVLDASGSMNYLQNGQTRFDIAKSEIAEIIDKSTDGSSYTLVYAGATNEFYLKEVTDKKTAKQVISELKVGYLSTEREDVLAAAQEFFDYKPSALTYLFTDKEYAETGNVIVFNVADEQENYALTGVTAELSGNRLKITGTALSYKADKELTLKLYFDGEGEAYASQSVQASPAGGQFEFLCDRTGYGYLKVAIAEEDGLLLDNEVILYDVAYQNISDILLVSDAPFFIEAALKSAGINKYEVLLPEEYAGDSGYGLYIFDTFMPGQLPDDGAVWFINPQGSLAGTNFSYQSEIDPNSSALYSRSTETTVKTLLSGIVKYEEGRLPDVKEFRVKKYIKCGLSASFITLATCDNNPILFVGSNIYGNREAVFSFDVHDSAQFTLSGDFSVLVRNLIDYSFPTVVEQTNFYCGDFVKINVIAGCNGIRIEKPQSPNKPDYPDSSVAICSYRLTEAGVYNIVFIMKDNSERVYNVFAALPEEERTPQPRDTQFTLLGTPSEEREDGYFDPLLYIFILIAALAVADYGVYCYEQYQLR